MSRSELATATLEQAEQHGWGQLVDAVARRRHAFHTLALATVGLDDSPRCRTVVLRGVEVERRVLWFHTDVRSPKFAELRHRPQATLLFYDAAAGLQLRAEAGVSLHHQDEVSEQRWALSRPSSRLCYSAKAGSSVRVAEPPAAPTRDDNGFAHFACVACRVRRLEWLFLHHAGHRRAEFVYDESGRRVDAGWLAP